MLTALCMSYGLICGYTTTQHTYTRMPTSTHTHACTHARTHTHTHTHTHLHVHTPTHTRTHTRTHAYNTHTSSTAASTAVSACKPWSNTVVTQHYLVELVTHQVTVEEVDNNSSHIMQWSCSNYSINTLLSYIEPCWGCVFTSLLSVIHRGSLTLNYVLLIVMLLNYLFPVITSYTIAMLSQGSPDTLTHGLI